jgi:hypothetical protein
MDVILLLIVPDPVRWYFAAASPDPRFVMLHCKVHGAALQSQKLHPCTAMAKLHSQKLQQLPD